jgi:hypothetical protein
MFWGLMLRWAIRWRCRNVTTFINCQLKSTTSLRDIPSANTRSKGLASGEKMKVPIFKLSDASKGMVRLYDDLIEWRHWRIRSSLELGRSNFTTIAVPLDCMTCRMVGFSCMYLINSSQRTVCLVALPGSAALSHSRLHRSTPT